MRSCVRAKARVRVSAARRDGDDLTSQPILASFASVLASFFLLTHILTNRAAPLAMHVNLNPAK